MGRYGEYKYYIYTDTVYAIYEKWEKPGCLGQIRGLYYSLFVVEIN